ncbi:conserved hypothetical protein [Histoplasma capsulatum H143]|uniref:Uncharacterized protein n=1 Tax=Ajellomyces capsulatus (strain H143) TaxID=544712 RepID=C6HGE7_AJECH|nr:conserved hypothetical protein [Histoplasma capsulatum H143]
MGARQELKGAETVRISSRARIRQGIRVGWYFYAATSSVAGRAMTWGAVDGVEKMGILKTSWAGKVLGSTREVSPDVLLGRACIHCTSPVRCGAALSRTVETMQRPRDSSGWSKDRSPRASLKIPTRFVRSRASLG